jgi:energy-converting hydrogenase Eha subunit A
MHAPQIIYIVLTFLGLGMALAGHDKPRNETHSFTTSAIAEILVLSLLFWGGFFASLGAAQIIYIALSALTIGAISAVDGQPKVPYNVFRVTFVTAVVNGVLFWGGFYG